MKKLNGIFKFLFSLLIVATIFACEFPGGNPFDDEGWDDNIENNDSIPGGDDVLPNDSIPGGDDVLPNDSIPGGDDIWPNDTIPGEDDVWPNDTIPGDDNVWPNDTIPGEDDAWPNDTIPGEDNVLPNDSIVSSGEFHNGHALVDLGLSVKWACCNVGATKPEEYGGYYAWGETEEKSNYDWDTYKYSYIEKARLCVSKYCLNENYGSVDNKTTLDASDDVASVKWGGSWRMPTYEEIQELNNICSWQWTTLNGVNGACVTGPNGNSIFLPAAGFRYGYNLLSDGSRGCYWSASLVEDNYCYKAYFLHDNLDFQTLSDKYDRNGALSVRPVCE